MNIILELNNKPVKPWARISWQKKVFGISCGIIGFFVVSGDLIQLAANYKKGLENAETREEELLKVLREVRWKETPAGQMCAYCGEFAGRPHDSECRITKLLEEAENDEEGA